MSKEISIEKQEENRKSNDAIKKKYKAARRPQRRRMEKVFLKQENGKLFIEWLKTT